MKPSPKKQREGDECKTPLKKDGSYKCYCTDSVADRFKEELIITVKHVHRIGWNDGGYQIVGRFPRFRKWWKFWEDNYEDLPLEIINLESKTL